ncbi:breast cancer type 2 susceptibility protein homolog [Sabethes cyaneus]|uniref:breast cancer type 2 susceptibility protein homolog n=1 Tax=Sabethes cyaneus TaxID=53552 RepID=UPI00237EC1AB|nr:breast cancer type 2 susceptibility protein homolog [Sabethes cyaneus]
MDEIPASPEIVKRCKRRRTTTGQSTLRRTRLSLNRERNNDSETATCSSVVLSENTNPSHNIAEREVQLLPARTENLFYIDDNTDSAELGNEDPLILAAILERADQIEEEHRAKQTSDFLANVQNRFVKIDEIIQSEEVAFKSEPSTAGTIKMEPTIAGSIKAEPVIVSTIKVEPVTTACSQKANYSYTQFELNTEMLDICEAADELAGLSCIPDKELKNCWDSTPNQVTANVAAELVMTKDNNKTPLRGRRNRWKNMRQSSLSRELCHKPRTVASSVDAKNFDFSDDSDIDLTIDYSKIVSSKLRAKLSKIQSFIDSPPQRVNKKSVHKTFSNRRSATMEPQIAPVIRRLSYESRSSSSTSRLGVEQVSSSSDDELNCLDGLPVHAPNEDIQQIPSTSPADDNFNSSLLIKANIDQLSQFFSKSVSEQAEEPKRDTTSLAKEPDFFGFPTEPTSPISLTSSGSPRIVSIAWLFRSESESDSTGETDCATDEQPKLPLHHLLDDDDDDDFLVQLHSSPKKSCDYESSMVPESGMADVKYVNQEPVSANSIRPRTTLQRSRSTEICYSNMTEDQPQLSTWAEIKTPIGIMTGVPEKGTERVSVIWDEQNNVVCNEREACAKRAEQPGPSFVGLKTAGGSSLTVSKSALAKANAFWSDVEREFQMDSADNTVGRNEILKPGKEELVKLHEVEPFSAGFKTSTIHAKAGCGFQTAGGNMIGVSEKAMEKARDIWKAETEYFTADENWMQVVRNENETCAGYTAQPVTSGYTGFKTAGGNSLTVSDSALAKANALFNDVEREFQAETTTEIVERNGFRNCIKEEFGQSRKPLAVEKAKAVSGFQTARGNSIGISEKALAKAQSIFEQMQNEEESEPPTSSRMQRLDEAIHGENDKVPSVKVEKRRLDEPCSPDTPLKRSKPNEPVNGELPLSTSTPNPRSMTDLVEGTNQIDHLFSDLDEHEFQHMFVADEGSSQSRRTRSSRQVRLVTKFEEINVQSPTRTNKSSDGNWDDSFGDLMARLSSELNVGLKVTEQILDLRRLARQRQAENCRTKPSSECTPRLYGFVKKKQQPCRRTVKEFVADSRPADGGLDVPERIRMLNVENVVHFKFDMVKLYGLNFCVENVDGIVLGNDELPVRLHLDDFCSVGMSELHSAFLSAPGIDPALLPSGWFENAWKWIVIKLSSMERNFYSYFKGITTPENVLDQLLYRYHKEIVCAVRPVIRKILEKDDIASRRMVLFAARIFRGQDPFEVELELSDGWYSIRTTVDYPLSQAISKGTITVGTKLMVQGAELLNLNEGCSPLEVPQNVRLKIHANSTRRAEWATKLGLYKVQNSFLISCNDILDQGGLIARLQIVVIRVYPLMFVDKSQRDTLGAVLRSERVERRHMQEVDAVQQKNYQTLLIQVQQEIEAEKSLSNGKHRSKKVPRTITSTQLPELLDNGVDFTGMENDFTATQQTMVVEHQRRQQEELNNEINQRVRERLQDNPAATSRKVSPLLKVRIVDCRKPEKVLMLSIWRPPDELGAVVQEGNAVEIRNATANGTRNGEVQLTTGKNSSYRQIDLQKFNFRKELLRNLTLIADIKNATFRPPFNEFDTIGVVVQVGCLNKKKFQTVYLADTAMNLLCVNFWNGISDYAYEDVVKERVVLCISNLQWRTINAFSSIPNSFATEYTTFSEQSKANHFSKELNNMRSSLSNMDLDAFYHECCSRILELKENKLPRSNSMNTPVRTTTDVSTPVRIVLSNTNFSAKTPVDFSPGVGQPISVQKQKIQLLAAAYKSPPKLTPIVMRSNPRVRKGFRLPAKLEDRIDQARQDDSIS